MRARAQWVLLATLATLPACEDPVDPLSSEAIAKLGQTRGDDRGYERSGLYNVLMTAVECPCEPSGEVRLLSMCAMVKTLSAGGDVAALLVEVQVSDGTVVFTIPEGPTPFILGPIYKDGEFEAGSTYSVNNPLVDAALNQRMEGSFTNEGDAGYTFAANLRHRVRAETTGRVDEDSEAPEFSGQCEEELELRGVVLVPG